jgi:hypothetical protein
VACSAASLVPERWKLGLEASGGRAIAFTTAQCCPEEDVWLGRLVEALGDSAAAGGPIELASRRAVDEAAWLLRYSAYHQRRSGSGHAQIPGDNAMYRRDALEEVRESWADGFWEHGVNEELVRRGHTLGFDHNARVYLVSVGGIAAFARQRFQHGRQFGATRPRRWMLPAAPLVPLVMLRAAWRNVRGSGKQRLFPRALPSLLLSASAWAAGEAVGRATGTWPRAR